MKTEIHPSGNTDDYQQPPDARRGAGSRFFSPPPPTPGAPEGTGLADP